MADEKISAMPNATALAGTEKLAGVQGGANVNVTPAQVSTFVRIAANGTDSGASSQGGEILISAGDGADSSARPSHGGNAYLNAGDGGNITANVFSSFGGEVHIDGGNAGSSADPAGSSYGGHVRISGGAVGAAGYYNIGGGVILTGADVSNAAVTAGNQGGNIQLSGGQAQHGGYYNNGGNIVLNGGNISGIKTTDHGGDVRISSGVASNYGRGGDVRITLPAGVTRNGQFIILNIPTAAPAVSGAVWSNLGILTIVP